VVDFATGGGGVAAGAFETDDVAAGAFPAVVGVVGAFATDVGAFAVALGVDAVEVVGAFAGGDTCFVAGVAAVFDGAAGVGAGAVVATGPGVTWDSEVDEADGTGVSVFRLHPLRPITTNAVIKIRWVDFTVTSPITDTAGITDNGPHGLYRISVRNLQKRGCALWNVVQVARLDIGGWTDEMLEPFTSIILPRTGDPF
jgi:hypothetical protein